MYYTETQKNEAKNTDIILFLEAIECFSFKKCGNEYHGKEHDSLVIKSDRRTWYWNSRGLCGRSALDWCIKVKGMTYTAAMQLLVGSPEGKSIIRNNKNSYIKKAPVNSGALNYVKISNKLLDLELTNTELSVITYLATIHTNVISKNGTAWIRVKQSTIAQKCAIKSVQTAGRVISSLIDKGLIWRSVRVIKSDNKSGTTCYALSLPSPEDGYFMLDRKAINGTLVPRQLRVYLHICRCIDNSIGYCWNSYNDLAKIIGMKRSDVIQTISELCELHYISKQRIKHRENRRVFADNHYAVIIYIAPKLYRRNKKIEAALYAISGNFCKNNIYTDLYYTSIGKHCQDIFGNLRSFSLSRGSPQNVMSFIGTNNLFIEKKKL